MRADRLLSILMLLQTRGRITAHELAEQLEVSDRTNYRDFEALSMAGIPLYTERGPGGGCSLVDGYQTRLTGLTETEIRALFLSTIVAPSADLGMGRALEAALPDGLVAKTHAWYLIGMFADTTQVFRISHMSNAKATDLSFTRPANFHLATCWREHQEHQTQQKNNIYFLLPTVSYLDIHIVESFQDVRYLRKNWGEHIVPYQEEVEAA